MNLENNQQVEDYNQLVELQVGKVLLEENYKKVEADKKKVEEEAAQLRGLVEELVGVVECPVCLVVPRQGGPVPVCPNGHFVCRTCRDRLRQDAGGEAAKCPSCTIELGNSTSLLASRLVERVKHQCEHFDCNEMVEFAQFETHLQVCQFRQVLCPGKGTLCKVLLPFNKVEEHVSKCGNHQFKHQEHGLENKAKEIYTVKKVNPGPLLYFRTTIVKAHGKVFFCKMKKDEDLFFWEMVMLGSEQECRGYRATLTILENNDKVFAMSAFHPRPISQRRWEKMGLYVPDQNLAWSDTENHYKFNMTISIDKS